MSVADKLVRFFGVHSLHTLAVLVGTTAVAFFAYSVYAALSGPLGTSIAALLTGTSLLGLTGIICAGLWWGLYRRPKQEAAKASPGESAERLLAALLQDELAQKIRTNPRESALTALTAGVILGASPKAREGLNDILRLLLASAD